MKKEIEFKNISKIFDKKVVGIKDVSFTINQGEFVFLVGKTGSGKSTILKLISGQIMPSAGSIWVRGSEVNKLKNHEIPYFRRQFGIMQRDLTLLDDRSVYDNIYLAMFATQQPKKIIKTRIEKTLATVGLKNKANYMPEELSAGEETRALLARAFVMDPKILVIDEPTANLSSGIAWDIMCLLDNLNKMGVTIIVASHSKELVNIMKKRVITLADGKVVSDEKRSNYEGKNYIFY